MGLPAERVAALLDDATADGKIDDPEMNAKESASQRVASVVGLVTAVAEGKLPRDAGIGQLQLLYGLTATESEQVMGSAGTGDETADAALQKALGKLWHQL